MPRSKKRFPFLTIRVARDGQSAETVRFHTSLANAKRYCEARNDAAVEIGRDEEYAVVVRADKRPSKGGELPRVRLVTPASTASTE